MEKVEDDDCEQLISRRSKAKQAIRRSSMRREKHSATQVCKQNMSKDVLNDSDLILAGIDFDDELSECTEKKRRRTTPLSPRNLRTSNSGKKQNQDIYKIKETLNLSSHNILDKRKKSTDNEDSLHTDPILFSPKKSNVDTISKEIMDDNFFDDDKDLFEDEEDIFHSQTNNTKSSHKKSLNNVISTKHNIPSEMTCLSVFDDDNDSFNDLFSKSGHHIQPKNSTCLTETEEIPSKISEQNTSHNTSDEMISQDDINRISLKERLKQKLRANTGTVTVKQNLEKDIKSEALRKARLDASQIRKEGGENDIGPFYGLPIKVKQLYEDLRGIKKLYDWQEECLGLGAVNRRDNLVYTLPTSGGKTLVAEVLIMRELLCHQRDALLVLPFVSIVQEKVQTISEFATELGFLVEEYAGGKGRFPPIKRLEKKSLYIATIEKGHSLVNSLIETERISNLGLVIVDEIHMVGEGGSRGANLESTMLKLMSLKDKVQIVGMSATLSNVEDLQQFLKAEVYKNDFRPVTLHEYVKIEDNIFRVNNDALDSDEKLQHEKIVTFTYTAEMTRDDPDHLLALTLEVIPCHSCLVFCPTKKNCENVAVMLSKMICKHHRELLEVNKAARRELLAELQQCGGGQLCPVLEFTVHFGIAYHHSGLTGDERKVIEEAYSNGTLCLLACTSTLAAGVNLPAKRVILRSPMVGNSLIKYSQYKQMVGRAGRAGIDDSGESILIVKPADRLQIKELLCGPKDYCYSSLNYDEGKGLTGLILSCVGLKLAMTVPALQALMQASLLSLQSSVLQVDVAALVTEALTTLHQSSLLTSDPDPHTGEMTLGVTALGKAAFKGCIDLTHVGPLHADLVIAQQSLYLSSHLHLLYLVTPYDAAHTTQPDWQIYLSQFCRLSVKDVKAAAAIGIPESYVNMKAAGRNPRKRAPPEVVVRRFYLTLVLWELWAGRTLWDTAHRFQLPRGTVQNLMTSAAAFASCVLHFCQELEALWPYQDLLGEFVKRLSHCTAVELLPLLEVPGVKVGRARQLYAAGYKTVPSLSHAEPRALVSAVPHLNHRQAKLLVAAAKNVVEEKAAALMEEVETLVADPQPIIEAKEGKS